MIVVDTSVWVDHLRSGDTALVALLEAREVLTHPFVIGELACANLANRAAIMALLDDLPGVTAAADEEVLFFIERHSLMGCGTGYGDAHLLAAAALSGDTRLPDAAYDDAVRQVTATVASQTMLATNREKYALQRDGVQVTFATRRASGCGTVCASSISTTRQPMIFCASASCGYDLCQVMALVAIDSWMRDHRQMLQQIRGDIVGLPVSPRRNDSRSNLPSTVNYLSMLGV